MASQLTDEERAARTHAENFINDQIAIIGKYGTPPNLNPERYEKAVKDTERTFAAMKPKFNTRAAEIEWLQSLLDHIEKGEIELAKESIGGAISILEAK